MLSYAEALRRPPPPTPDHLKDFNISQTTVRTTFNLCYLLNIYLHDFCDWNEVAVENLGFKRGSLNQCSNLKPSCATATIASICYFYKGTFSTHKRI